MKVPLPLVPFALALSVVMPAVVFILRVTVVPLVEYLMFLSGQVVGFGLRFAKKSVARAMASK